jgi:hypothetical protein
VLCFDHCYKCGCEAPSKDAATSRCARSGKPSPRFDDAASSNSRFESVSNSRDVTCCSLACPARCWKVHPLVMVSVFSSGSSQTPNRLLLNAPTRGHPTIPAAYFRAAKSQNACLAYKGLRNHLWPIKWRS